MRERRSTGWVWSQRGSLVFEMNSEQKKNLAFIIFSPLTCRIAIAQSQRAHTHLLDTKPASNTTITRTTPNSQTRSEIAMNNMKSSAIKTLSTRISNAYVGVKVLYGVFETGLPWLIRRLEVLIDLVDGADKRVALAAVDRRSKASQMTRLSIPRHVWRCIAMVCQKATSLEAGKRAQIRQIE